MKLEPVKHVKTRKGQGVDELVREMEGSGVMACGELGRAVSVLEKMVRDKKSINFFGVAGAMVPGGMRDIIREFLGKKMVPGVCLHRRHADT